MIKSKTEKRYTIEVQQSEDCFIEIPPELLDKVDWKVGDDIKFEIQEDGSIHLKKVKLASVELDFDDEELFKYMKEAHKRNMSFNDWCEKAIEAGIEIAKEEG